MIHRLYKPARKKEIFRGLFSYLTESVINMVNYTDQFKNCEIKYYHDLFEIPGYGNQNVFDICLLQDTDDFKNNKSEYKNIETIGNPLNLIPYNLENYTFEIRGKSAEIVKNFFIPNDELLNTLNKRHSEIDFNNTIGIHRRSTDIGIHHKIVDLQKIFDEVEKSDFDNIFLMCDNVSDSKVIKKRYGNKLITYDEFTSVNPSLPFFKYTNSSEGIKRHVEELVFGVFTLPKTKKFVCTKSNISTFVIMSSPDLIYTILD